MRVNSIRKDYILPDFINMHRGIVQSPTRSLEEQTKVCLGVERFATPEILFHPSNIEKNQMGIVEAINFSARQIPKGKLFLIKTKYFYSLNAYLFNAYIRLIYFRD